MEAHFLTPRPHQVQARDAALSVLQQGNRVSIILPCGTGKTFVGAMIDEALSPKTLLLLFPSIALIKQTLDAWRDFGVLRDRKCLCVCSDKSVSGNDENVVTEHDLGVRISTAPDEVREAVRKSGAHPIVLFSTYHSAPIVAAAFEGLRTIDLGIYDEAHRTVSSGGGSFSFALDDRNLPITKRVFMTATPRHVVAESDDEDAGAFSMDNERVFGPQAFTLSMREAIEQSLICDYEVLVSGVTSNEIAQMMESAASRKGHESESLAVAGAVAMRKAINETGARKIFSFHRTVAAAKRFAESPAIRRELGCEVLHINGKMSSQERKVVLDRFVRAECAVVTNARCLSEGVDVPSVDMIFFADPKSSVIDIVQAVGRAQRKSAGKHRGYVLLPAHINTSHAGKQERAQIENGHLHAIYNVLSRLSEQENVVACANATSFNSKKKSAVRSIPYRIIAEDSQVDFLRSAINIHYATKNRSPWEDNFDILQAYSEKTGNTNPSDKDLPELAAWLRHVRFQYKQGALSVERQKMLESIGLQWDGREAAWRQKLEEWKAGSRGTRWERNQREEYRKGALSTARIEALVAAGFVLDPLAERAKTQHQEPTQEWSSVSSPSRKRRKSPDHISMLDEVVPLFDCWKADPSSENEGLLLDVILRFLEGDSSFDMKSSAVSFLEHMADAGSVVAKLNLAIAKIDGDGCALDYPEANTLLEDILRTEKSPSLLKAKAYSLIAENQALGKGVEASSSKAASLYNQANQECSDLLASSSVSQAERTLIEEQWAAGAFGFGVVFEEVAKRATDDRGLLLVAEQYAYAAKLGHTKAMTNLALLPPVKEFVLSESGRLDLLRTAAKNGDALAQKVLEDCMS